MNHQQKYFFYINSLDKIAFNFDLLESYYLKIWKPSILELTPKGLKKTPFILWSIMHHLKLFSGSDYRIFLIYYDNKIIHYTVVLPKHFKYPFMTEKDIQIGPTWTHEEHRRKGIASYIVSKIIEKYKGSGGRFWYITREENISSKEFIESLGFLNYGTGFKKKRFGLDFLGYFYITDKK